MPSCVGAVSLHSLLSSSEQFMQQSPFNGLINVPSGTALSMVYRHLVLVCGVWPGGIIVLRRLRLFSSREARSEGSF